VAYVPTEGEPTDADVTDAEMHALREAAGALGPMVRLFVAITDRTWFEMPRASSPHDGVNFWQPSGSTQFRALAPGDLFLFKLHGPDNNIVGGGIFSHASIAPLSIAWEAFRPKNGVASADEMRKRVAYYRREPSIIELRQDFR
jgi:putative restriction endonuclease